MTVAPTPLPRRPATRRPPTAVIVTVVAFLAIAVVLGVLAQTQVLGSNGSPTIQGSGAPVAQTRVLPPFTAVTMAGDCSVSVVSGSPQHVVVSADDNLLRTVRTTVRAGTLRITTPGSFSAVSGMQVAITVPRVDALRLSGTGELTATGSTPPL